MSIDLRRYQNPARTRSFAAVITDADGIKTAIKGGGGTCMKPVFDDIQKRDLRPDWGIIFTDMDIYDLREIKEPPYPFLWCVNNHVNTPPWGQHLVVEA